MAALYKHLRAHIPQAAISPGKWLGFYEDFVSENSSSVSQIETALHSLTYIIPGTVRNPHLATTLI